MVVYNHNFKMVKLDLNLNELIKLIDLYHISLFKNWQCISDVGAVDRPLLPFEFAKTYLCIVQMLCL